MAQLTLRKTSFDGIVYEEVFIVVSDGRDIGRILVQPGVTKDAPNWYWGIILPGRPQRPDWRGHATSYEKAKQAFKERWERLQSEIR